MSNKIEKRIRKVAAKKARRNLEDLAKTLSNEKLYWRIVYGLRIIFKYHPEPIKFTATIKEN